MVKACIGKWALNLRTLQHEWIWRLYALNCRLRAALGLHMAFGQGAARRRELPTHGGTGAAVSIIVNICKSALQDKSNAKKVRWPCIARAKSAILKLEEAMKMFNKGHQKIDCRVCSCEHHGTGDVCDLECICVQPMNGADQGDAASQTLCGSYKCRK